MNDAKRPLAVRAYRALLRVLHPALGQTYRADAENTFHDQYREVRSTGGAIGSGRLFVRSVWLLLTSSIEGDATVTAPRDGRRRRGGQVWQDVRYSIRSMRKRPGFAATAILILAIGIGATTTIFSIVDTVVLRQLPYPGAGQLMHFANGAHSYPSFRDWREMTSFEAVVAARDDRADLSGDRAPERLSVASVSETFFQTLGAAPHLGRLFTPSDYPGDGSIAVLGHGAWQRLWGGDPGMVGRTITLNRAPVTIVGVLSPDFTPPAIETGSRVDVWRPLDDGGVDRDDHGYHVLGIVGRLAPGVSVETAQAELDARVAAAAAEVPGQYTRRDGTLREIGLVSLRDATVGDVRTTLYLLLGAAGLMLLIACANVANLFLARGTSRLREIAVRKALGASRGRIVGLVLTESVVLSVAGGLAGLAIAYGGVEAFRAFNPGGVPRIDQVAVDLRILLASLGIAVATGVIFGTLPAVQASRGPVAGALQDDARSTTAGRGGLRVRNTLVVVEIALALVLCVGAGLLFRTLTAIASVDPGFRSEGLTVVQLSIDNHAEEARPLFAASLVHTIAALPGTTAVAAGWSVPFRYTGSSRCCWRTTVEGDPSVVGEDGWPSILAHPITANYFETLEATLATGREFTAADMTSSESIVILNRAAARVLFNREDVVGRQVRMADRAFTVIGVAEGVRHWGSSEDIEMAVYLPFGEFGGEVPYLNILVRSTSNQAALNPALRDVVRRADPLLPVDAVTTMEAWVSRSVARPRFLALLFGGFAGVALLLAAGGVYGSMLYTVGQRRREMGIRLALGADGSSVMRLVVRQALAVTAIGLVCGLVAAVAASTLMTSLVWGVTPTDPATLAGVAGVLAAAALVASAIPAWRASRTDPLETLRSQ